MQRQVPTGYGNREEIRGILPRISSRSLALSALGPWTLLLRTFILGRHLPWFSRVSLRLLLEECHHTVAHEPFAHGNLDTTFSSHRIWCTLLRSTLFDSGYMFLSFLVGFWTYLPYFST